MHEVRCKLLKFISTLFCYNSSNRIGMKFVTIVLQVNIHASIDESDFSFDAVLSRRRPWRHFTAACRSLLHMQSATR